MNLIFVLLGLFAVFFGFRKVANSLVDEVIEISIDHFSYRVDKDQQIAFFLHSCYLVFCNWISRSFVIIQLPSSPF